MGLEFEIGHIQGEQIVISYQASVVQLPERLNIAAGEKVAASQFGSFRQKEHATKIRVHNI